MVSGITRLFVGLCFTLFVIKYPDQAWEIFMDVVAALKAVVESVLETAQQKPEKPPAKG